MFISASIFLLSWKLVGSSNTTSTPAVGGATVPLGQMPHAVVLHMYGNGRLLGKCTGSIIHESWVLTAAHCVVFDGKTSTPGDIMITAGVIDYEKKGPSTQDRNGTQIIVHPKYYDQKLAMNDLALIKVRPFTINDIVKPVKLSGSEWPQDGRMYNRKCTSAGWGMLEGRKKTSILHKQETVAKHGMKGCHCTPDGFMLKRLICLTPDKSGVCFGDSGGALLCDGEAVGVSHMVVDKRGCSYFKSPDATMMCESPDVFGAFIYICPYLKWIREHVPSVPPPPASCPAPPTAPLSRGVILVVLLTSLCILKLIKQF